METRTYGGRELSRLMLGTAQLGLPSYGIANQTGQPSYAEARALVACAFEGGVTGIDTAAGYGTSEEILGRILAELRIADQVMVVSKVMHMVDHLDAVAAAAAVEASVTRSLQRLRLEQLPVCLFHLESNFCYHEALLRLKERGLVGHIGSSVMTLEATAAMIAGGQAEALQIPTNVLDRRYTGAGLCRQAAQRGMAVFVRSIYLQGLLLLSDEATPPELAAVNPVRRRLRALAEEAGKGLTELAARYILGLEGVTCAVIGVETVDQMRQNLALFGRGPLPADLQQAINAAVPDLPDRILMPTLWPRRSP
jgi:aryl-alcohol dehydrogenase-like predicted oxidoreductase